MSHGKASIKHLYPSGFCVPDVICMTQCAVIMKRMFDFVGHVQKADPAFAVTLKFVLAGILWVLFSDPLLHTLFPSSTLWKLPHIHILKSLFFLAIIGAALFVWASRYVSSLEKRENEVQNLFQSSPIAMGIIDAKTFRFIEVNQSLLKLFDVTARDLRDITMGSMPVEQERYEAVPLIIKTGAKDLGTWKFHKGNGVISVDMTSQSIRDNEAFLIIFTDVTNQVRGERDMISLRGSLERQYNERLENLIRVNEELAYRASQSEHVNQELIAINEQLQYVNKKIVLRAEDTSWKNDRLEDIMTSMSDAFWSFDLTGRARCFVSVSAAELYEECAENLSKPWFWLDYVHPEDDHIKISSQQQLTETGYCATTHRIITRRGNEKLVFLRIKLYHDPKGSPMIIGSISDVTNLDASVRKPGTINPHLRQA